MANALIGALRVTLGIDTGAFDRGLTDAQRKLIRTGREFDKIGTRMQSIGKSLSLQLTLPILAIGAAVLKTAGNFEAAMNKVEAATGAAGKELKAMRDQAKAFGADKSFTATATQSAEVMEMLAKNGLSVSQILGGAAESTLKLAAATGADFAPAADLATDIVQQFGKQASDLSDVVDKVTGALIVSKFGFEDYQLAIGQAGGVAGGLGVSFEDMNTAIAATSALFASGSDAGTSFKTFLTRLVPESKEAAGIMKQFGIEFFDATGKMKPLGEVAEHLKDKLGGLSDEAKTLALKKLFGTDAMRTAIGLMNQGADGIARVNVEINKASAQTQMEARMKGLNGGLTQLKKSAEALAIALGDSGFLTAAANFVAAITNMIGVVARLPAFLLTTIGIFAGVAAAMGPVIFITGSLIKTWGLMLTLGARIPAVLAGLAGGASAMAGGAGVAARAFGALQKAMLFLRGPWGLAILAIVAALGYLYSQTNKAIVASAEHRNRSEQLGKAQEALRGITDRLATATGAEAAAAMAAARAAQVKAANDVRAAKAALIRASAEIQLAKAMAAQAFTRFQASTQSSRGAGGGTDPSMIAGNQARAAQQNRAQKQADFNQAYGNLKTSVATLNSLNAAISAPANIPDIKLSNPSIGGGGDTKSNGNGAGSDHSEQLAKERMRLQHEMDQEALEGQRTLIDAQLALTTGVEARAQLTRESLELERQLRDKEIDHDLAMVLADTTISAQQKEEAVARAQKQKALNEQVTSLRHQAINEDEAEQLQDNIAKLRQGDFDRKKEELESQASIARTAAERRTVELELLRLAYEQRRRALQDIIDKDNDSVEAEQARRDLAALGSNYSNDRQGVVNSTRGPLEEWAASVPQDAAQINEALQSIQVQGLEGLTDAIMGIIDGTQSLKQAFKSLAKSIVADLVKMIIKMLIFRALSAAFPGLFPSAGVPAVAGVRAAGGPVSGGKSYLVGEEGPELFTPSSAGMIIPNAANNNSRIAANDGGPINVHVTVEASSDLMVKAAVIADSRIRAAAPQIIRTASNVTLRAAGRTKLMGR